MVRHGSRTTGLWAGARGSVSEVEFQGECLLFGRLNRFLAVVGTHPGNGLIRRGAGEDSEAGEGGAGTAISAQTTDLDLLTGSRPSEQILHRQHGIRLIGNAEVWPNEV